MRAVTLAVLAAALWTAGCAAPGGGSPSPEPERARPADDGLERHGDWVVRSYIDPDTEARVCYAETTRNQSRRFLDGEPLPVRAERRALLPKSARFDVYPERVDLRFYAGATSGAETWEKVVLVAGRDEKHHDLWKGGGFTFFAIDRPDQAEMIARMAETDGFYFLSEVSAREAILDYFSSEGMEAAIAGARRACGYGPLPAG